MVIYFIFNLGVVPIKKCRSCKITKPFSEYHKGSNGAKYHYHCKSCRSKQQAQEYKDKWFSKYTIIKKSECKRKGLPFDLTKEFLESIWTGVCPIFKKELVKHDKKNPFCPALDRIDPSKGYIQGNVVWISSRANRIKYDATLDELKMIVNWLEGATTISKESTPK